MKRITVGTQVIMIDPEGNELSGKFPLGVVTSYRTLSFSKKRLFVVRWGGLTTHVLEDYLKESEVKLNESIN